MSASNGSKQDGITKSPAKSPQVKPMTSSDAHKRTHTQFEKLDEASSLMGAKDLKNTESYRDERPPSDRPTKLTRKTSNPLGGDDDDEENEGDFGNRPQQPMDKSFYELLVTFAQLDAATDKDKEASEPCPLCGKEFKASKFALHVIECVESRETEERIRQIDEDEKLALAVQLSEQADASKYKTKCRYGDKCYDQSPEHMRRFAHPQKKKEKDEDTSMGDSTSHPTPPESIPVSTWELAPTAKPHTKTGKVDFDGGTAFRLDGAPVVGTKPVCQAGKNCRRTDAQHFISLIHPQVNCPICDQQFEVSMVEAHVTLCINAGPPPASVMAAFGVTPTQSPASFSAVREADGEESDDEELDETRKKEKGKKGKSGDKKAQKSTLSRQQMGAMATLLVQQQSKGAAKQEHSVLKLLESFKTLGFTKETLQSALQDSQGSSGTSSSSSSSSLFSSPSPSPFSSTLFSSTISPFSSSSSSDSSFSSDSLSFASSSDSGFGFSSDSTFSFSSSSLSSPFTFSTSTDSSPIFSAGTSFSSSTKPQSVSKPRHLVKVPMRKTPTSTAPRPEVGTGTGTGTGTGETGTGGSGGSSGSVTAIDRTIIPGASDDTSVSGMSGHDHSPHSSSTRSRSMP